MFKEEIAYSKGYRVSPSGIVTNPVGYEMSVESLNNKRYPQVGFSYEGKKYYVRMHRLAAYCMYGKAMFEEGVVVRHLNDNKTDLRHANIALGTQTDNMRDIPLDKLDITREKHRAYALANKVLPPRVLKIQDGEVPTILARLDAGSTHRELAKEYRVHHSTIGYIHTTRRHTHGANTN